MEYIKNNKKRKINLIILIAVISIVATISAAYLKPSGKRDENNPRNSDAFYDALYELNNGNKVMVILLDGLGISAFNMAFEKGLVPFTGGFEAITALAYYPTITPVGTAAMLTGFGPEKNGIKKRGDMNLKVDDIFKRAAKLNKKSILVEGDIKIINTSIEPLLNVNLNDNAYTDDEVFESALDAVKENGTDLLFIHFHGIDDASHKYGPFSDEAMERINTLDGYIKKLYKEWDGALIISADHGQHETKDGGGHGTEGPLDMQVPYIYVKRPLQPD